MKFIDYAQIVPLSEIPQNISLQYAFVTKTPRGNWKALHPLVKCRDFLGDALLSTFFQEKWEPVYRFQFDGKETPVNLEQLQLVVRVEDETLLNNVELLNKVERSLGIEGTTITRIGSKNEDITYFLILGDKVWLSSVPMLSLYTYLIRALVSCEKPSTCLDDAIQFSEDESQLHATVLNFLKKNEMLIEGFIKKLLDAHNKVVPFAIEEMKQGAEFHEYSGIGSLIEKIQAKMNNSIPPYKLKHYNNLVEAYNV